MAKTYNDPVKQKAREKLREFIKRNLRTSPSQATVVCFPGAEVEGEEALEVREVYDEIGIPRQNVVGLEYNRESAQRLQRANLGIEVVCTDAYDFFKTTDRKFDVISLDYTGPRTWQEMDITRFIVGRQILDKFGIFSTNHLVKREARAVQQGLLSQALLRNASFDCLPEIPYGASQDDIREAIEESSRKQFDSFADLSQRLPELDLKFLREQITLDNIAGFGGGTIETDPANNMFRTIESDKGIEEIIKKSKPTQTKGLTAEVPGYWTHKNFYRDSLAYAVATISNNPAFTKAQAQKILQVIAGASTKAYILRDLARYRYTSNKNSNMLFDIMAFKPISYSLQQKALQIISINPHQGRFRINPYGLDRSKLIRKIKELEEAVDHDYFNFKLPESEYLGSSYIPPKQKEKISREGAIDLLRSGSTPAEIAECYRGFTKMQLAAFKAHYVTMGKPLAS